eukprot:s3048_g8.t1
MVTGGSVSMTLCSHGQDHIHPLEQVIFDVVRPDPPRTASRHDFVFDLLVSQGVEAPRRAGLVTVLQRDDRAARAAYAVAVSLPEFTSGHQIVQFAEALPECGLRSCTIRHGRLRILFSTDPVHEMQDGDSFVISVTSQPSGQAASSHDSGPSAAAFEYVSPEGPEPASSSSAPRPALATGPPQADLHRGAVEHKPNTHGEVILDDEPIIQAPGTSRHRPKPSLDGDYTWMNDLHAIFQEFADIAVIGGNPLLYLQTWFVHHERHPVSHYPRSIRVDNTMITWLDVIRQTWLDRLDPNLPFSIHVVRPTPPKAQWQSYACHVILEQAKPANRAACHLTTLFGNANRNVVSMSALSLPRFACIPDVIDAASMQPQCEHRRWTVRAGSVHLNVAIAVELNSGTGIRFRVAPPAAQRPVSPGREPPPVYVPPLDATDAAWLLQTSVAVDLDPARICLTVHDKRPATCKLDSEPVEPTLVPSPAEPEQIHIQIQLQLPSIRDQPQFIQDLYGLWEPVATLCPGRIERRGFVVVWFLDAVRMPECHIARAAALHDDFTQWMEEILQI